MHLPDTLLQRNQGHLRTIFMAFCCEIKNSFPFSPFGSVPTVFPCSSSIVSAKHACVYHVRLFFSEKLNIQALFSRVKLENFSILFPSSVSFQQGNFLELPFPKSKVAVNIFTLVMNKFANGELIRMKSKKN